MLIALNYLILGYCCVRYRVCDETNAMTLGSGIGDASQTKALQGVDCINDYIVIEGKCCIAHDLNSFAGWEILFVLVRMHNIQNVLILLI